MKLIKEFTVRLIEYPGGRYKLNFPAEFQWRPVFFRVRPYRPFGGSVYNWAISNYLFFQRAK